MDIKLKTLRQFSRFGILHRDDVKNYLGEVEKLITKGFVQKTYRKGKVFYELTPRAIPILELERTSLLAEVKMFAQLTKSSSIYNRFLEDIRLLNEKDKKAADFIFLNDWQLKDPVVPAQLELSKFRYLKSRGLL